MAFTGVCLNGFSVGLFKLSMFGTDPFQCFMSGTQNVTRIPFGTLYVIINLILLVCVFFLDRHYIGIATFVNIFGLGYIVQFSTNFLGQFLSGASLLLRIVLLASGIIITCFGAALYYTANLGVSTYDAIALILADKKVAKFQYCRIGTDLICVLVGLVFRAVIGIGTLVTAFFMGPLIAFFNVHVARPLLAGGKRAGEPGK
jgi:uncharacterized membrane protein YczE